MITAETDLVGRSVFVSLTGWQRQAELGDGDYDFAEIMPKACDLEDFTHQIRCNRTLAQTRSRIVSMMRRSVVLICASLLIGCQGSPMEIGSRSPEQLRHLSDEELRHNYYMLERGPFAKQANNLKAEIDRRDRQKESNYQNAIANASSFDDFEAIAGEYPWHRSDINEARRLWYLKSNEDISDRIGKCIQEKKITLGMSENDVIASWGPPEDINRTVYTFGVHSQWIYHGQYLYFENGVLRSWQD